MLSLEKSDLLDDESSGDRSDSWSAVHVLFIFALTNPLVVLDTPLVVLKDPLSQLVALFVFVPKVVESKGGQLIEIFWPPKP